MKVLVVGAGVIGSFNAARLFRGGVDVTLLARGERLAALRDRGVVLEDWRTRRRSVTPVPIVDRIAPGSCYDLAVVIVRRDQVASVLPLLAAAPSIPSVLFLGNNLAGSSDMAAALGSQRVLTGMVNAGGQRDGVVVRYIWTRRLRLLFGERNGLTRVRTRAIADMFRGAGLPARVVTDAEAYQKTHAAGLPAFAGALYSAGGDIRLLGRRHDLLHLLVTGYRDALSGLQADGTAIRPRMTRALVWTPERLLHVALRQLFDTELAVVGGQAHALAAVGEMRELAEELRAILGRTGMRSPANDQAYAAIVNWADGTAAR
ncbi:ketopantoate reductase family protein [Mycobacterium sp.]|uniref:ketopantoate reductase family protein n=1 Tax=Mycobacterium sp. TaxID=1785 RepID=UPI002BD344CB|nr:2-dehydropantoate 2-reductase N-terminal domain-containing protein [Mycobacterium sp.]HTY34367.1 2-dehydropantoate 2-reductase N-terminal domain-containing protein [Mycobacterium sp.]